MLRRVSPILFLAAVGLAGCGGDAGPCADGFDNDGDGLVDSADPGCRVSDEEGRGREPQCQDFVDNDGDGLIDLDDPGCTSLGDDDELDERIAQCDDGIDNDGDGLTDYPFDPGCSLSVDDDEGDGCPDGADCPACSNGIDDDDDGVADFPDDSGCNSAADRDELNLDPSICGATVPLTALPADGKVMGTFFPNATNDLISTSCGGAGGEVAYLLHLDAEASLQIRTDFPETTADTVVYVRSDCRQPSTELACGDDQGTERGARALVETLPAGDYYIVVDSQLGGTGDFRLEVTSYLPEGGTCDPAIGGCAPGKSCGDDNTCGPLPPGPTCLVDGAPRLRKTATPGSILINEVMIDPAATVDFEGEWFELRVTADIDLNGIAIGRPDSTGALSPALFTFESPECLPVTAGDYLVVARDVDPLVNGGLPAVDYLYPSTLPNTNSGLYLAIEGTTLDIFSYVDATEGAATSRDETSGAFCPATAPYGDGDLGTPGAANPACP